MVIISRGMKEYKISNFADLMQALEENPEWLEELRRMILTEELLELPRRFEEFRHRVEERLNILEERAQKVEGELKAMRKELDKNLCSLKGMLLEMKVRKKVPFFFSEYLLNAKIAGQDKISKALSLAVEKGIVSKEDRKDVFRLDLIVEGNLLSTKEPVLVAVEISYTIAKDDVQRAVKRAEILKKAMDRKVLPAVVGCRISKNARKLTAKTGCLKVLVSE
jgi:hypothetical protein